MHSKASLNRTALLRIARSKMIAAQVIVLALYVSLSVYAAAPAPTIVAYTLLILGVIAATAVLTYHDDMSRQRCEADALASDLRAELRAREDDIIADSRARPEYREACVHTPAAQAILDRRDAEYDHQRAQDRAARQARLQAAGRLPA